MIKRLASPIAKTSAVEKLDQDRIKNLKRDFNLLLKNIPLLDTYEKAFLWSGYMRTWNDRFHVFIFEHLVPALEKDKSPWSYKIRSDCWSLYVEFLNIPLHPPTEYHSKNSRFSDFLKEKKSMGRSYSQIRKKSLDHS